MHELGYTNCGNTIDQKATNEQSYHPNDNVLHNVIVSKSGGNSDSIIALPMNNSANISKVVIVIRTRNQRSNYNLQIKNHPPQKKDTIKIREKIKINNKYCSQRKTE